MSRRDPVQETRIQNQQHGTGCRSWDPRSLQRGLPCSPANPPPPGRACVSESDGLGSDAVPSLTNWSRWRVMILLSQGVSVWKWGDKSHITGLFYTLSKAVSVKCPETKGANALRGREGDGKEAPFVPFQSSCVTFMAPMHARQPLLQS